jgi:predicted  nucleic acid-binding Zn-ribbon protein
MNSTRTVAIRLDNLVAQEYERLAQLKGDKLGTYLRDLLTTNIQMASIERQVSRIEELVNEFEKDINRSLDKFTQQNRLNEKFYEDFGGVYMMLLSTLMQLKVEKEDIRGMQAKGDAYAQRNYLAGKK